MTRMHSNWITTLTTLAASALLSAALAQPDGPPPGPPDGPPPRELRDPLRAALDSNHDFELDADEIAKAPEALAKLDKDGDGKISGEEFRPPMGPPPGGPGREPGAERPRRPGEPGGRPPRTGRDGPPPRDGESPDGPPPREGGRPAGGDRPSPERFLERAMTFDADGDGKLDESELGRFAEAMAERMRGRGPGGPPRDGGERPERPRRPE